MGGPLSGTIGGRYALCGEIASGGMATVHLARQVGAAGFARIVAIKRLHERYARDPDFVGMFLDEARIVARVRHPNVVQTVDVVAESGELFLVMEYVHGESLLRLTQMANRRNAVVPIPVIAAILAGALHGLHEAHEARSETGEPLGIVHRDISPHNILVGVDGIPRVLDFGVAKASQRIQTTQEGQLKGKLSYMAPEQVTNRHVDRRTDIYAAAVVLWETLTGTKLFQGDSEGAVLNQILLEDPRSPSALNRAIPAALEAVVLRGLSREPSDRFATAREMALAIEHSGPLATPSEIGELISLLCNKSVEARGLLIATIEMKSSSSNLREAVDSLRVLAADRQDSVRVRSEQHVLPVAVPSTPPIQTLPPPDGTPPGRMPDTALGGSYPPPGYGPTPSSPGSGARPVSHGGAGLGPNSAAGGGGRVVAVVAGSIALIVAIFAIAGYVLIAKRRSADALAASAASGSAIVAAGDGGDEPRASSTATASGALGVATIPTTSCPDGMALVPGGRFFMGSDDDLPAERPAHKVILRAYCMDKLEVTTDSYRTCSDRGDCKRAGVTNKWDGITAKDSKTYDPLCNATDAARGKHPVNCVDWNMADRFCKAEGKRLPTEAEWEFAARGSDGRKYPWGDAAPSVNHLNACGAECVAWGKKHGAGLEGLFGESDAWPTTAPVGSFPQGASRWGIEDIVGNVWEWVADNYAPYTEADQDDPRGPPAAATRVMRGGAWNGAYADWVRPSFRFHNGPETRSHGVGFRCAKTP